jgi:hypothetical protein
LQAGVSFCRTDMKKLWILFGLLPGMSLPMYAMQARTPQAALEEIATTEKPDVLVRHLPEEVQKSIEVLPNPQKQQVMEKLLSIKVEQLAGCSIRRADGVDVWEIINQQGEIKGKVKLANAFTSGLESLLSLKFESGQGVQMFVVAMHLEGDDWRIDNFGAWENTDLGLRKLVHQPTQLEKNEAAAQVTLRAIIIAVLNYAQQFPRLGFPVELQALVGATSDHETTEGHGGLLDASFTREPLVKNGYEFRYTLTRRGNLQYLHGVLPVYDSGEFRITASPTEFGKTGSRNYMANQNGVHVTSENRDATDDDPAPEDPD